jgi:signal transduction histidine kinase
MISGQTVIIIIANVLTALLCSSLMLLVWWQAPRDRINRWFTVLMATVVLHAHLLIVFRFLNVIDFDPNLLQRITLIVYVAFFTLLLQFSAAFTESQNVAPLRLLRIASLSLLAAHVAAAVFNIPLQLVRPSAGDSGGYVSEYTPLGVALLLMLVLLVVSTLLIVYRIRDERGRAVFPAVVAISSGLALVNLRVIAAALNIENTPLGVLFLLPYNSLGMLIGALILGRAVLRYQLFDPMVQLNRKLEVANRELEQANMLRSQFLMNISHELRTPLNAIIGYTQLTLDEVYGPLNTKQRERLDSVIRSSRALMAMIEDMLDINRIEKGQIVLSPQTLDVMTIIEDVQATYEPLAQKKGLEFSCTTMPDLPMISVDPARARQVLINLVSNAIKFTQQGKVQIQVDASPTMLNIRVSDTGIGIAPEAIPTIFEEFRQLDGSTTRQHGGSGIGLSLARRLTELHNGNIRVESKPGVGSTFTVSFPVVQPAPVAS